MDEEQIAVNTNSNVKVEPSEVVEIELQSEFHGNQNSEIELENKVDKPLRERKRRRKASTSFASYALPDSPDETDLDFNIFVNRRKSKRKSTLARKNKGRGKKTKKKDDPKTFAQKLRYINNCHLCSAKFDRIEDFQKHQAKHLEADGLLLSQSKEFSDNDEMVSQSSFKKTISFNDDDVAVSSSEEATDGEETKKSNAYKCHLCSSNFELPNKLEKHLEKHKSQRTLTCKRCSFKTLCKSTLYTHMSTKCDTVKLRCRLCFFKAKSRHLLDSHYMKEHSKKNDILEVSNKNDKFGCKHCDVKCTTKGALKRHYYNTHAKEKPYLCSVVGCGQSFGSFYSLDKHSKMKHNNSPISDFSDEEVIVNRKNDVKPCPICGYTAKHKDLLYHMESKHNKKTDDLLVIGEFDSTDDEGKPPILCSICNIEFTRVKNFCMHVKSFHSSINNIRKFVEAAIVASSRKTTDIINVELEPLFKLADTTEVSTSKLAKCGKCKGCKRLSCGKCDNCIENVSFGNSKSREKICQRKICCFQAPPKHDFTQDWKSSKKIILLREVSDDEEEDGGSEFLRASDDVVEMYRNSIEQLQSDGDDDDDEDEETNHEEQDSSFHMSSHMIQSNEGVNISHNVSIKNLEEKTENVYSCTQCSFQTVEYDEINDHMSQMHLMSQVFLCEKCPFKTNYENQLTKHIEEMHENEKMLSCHFCEFTTPHKMSLEIHKKAVHKTVQLTEKPKPRMFICPVCHYQDKSEELIHVHMISNHPESCVLVSSDSLDPLGKASIEINEEMQNVTIEDIPSNIQCANDSKGQVQPLQ